MIAVCPTHHREIGKYTRSRQYEIKRNPKNRQTGQINGHLATNKSQFSFRIGSNTFINPSVILSYFGQPIISCRIESGQNLLSVYLPKDDFWPEVKIIDNEVFVWTDGLWDIEFRTNYMKVMRADKRFFEIDLRGEHTLVRGNLLIGGKRYHFDENGANFGGNLFMQNCTFPNRDGAVKIGDPRIERILLPNFAMANPRVQFLRFSDQE